MTNKSVKHEDSNSTDKTVTSVDEKTDIEPISQVLVAKKETEENIKDETMVHFPCSLSTTDEETTSTTAESYYTEESHETSTSETSKENSVIEVGVLDQNCENTKETTTVGIQIDLDDPDVYYFAGGRHVALQTDSISDEFGPLEPFIKGTEPIQIVFCSNEENEAIQKDESDSRTNSAIAENKTTSFPLSIATMVKNEETTTSDTSPTKPSIPTIIPKTIELRTELKSATFKQDRNITALPVKSLAISKGITSSIGRALTALPPVRNHLAAVTSTSTLMLTRKNSGLLLAKSKTIPFVAPSNTSSGLRRKSAGIEMIASSKSVLRKVGTGGIPAVLKGRSSAFGKSSLENGTLRKQREIGEDGWETVRSRSNRSKWSSMSSRSSSSSNNDLLSGSGTGAASSLDGNGSSSGNNDSEIATASQVASEDARTEKEEAEKIQEKEAALDSAMLEEEMIEAELAQVEKDFEQIEAKSKEDRIEKPQKVNEAECEEEENIKKDGGEGFFIQLENNSQESQQGRILALREKLMSPVKKRDSAETLLRRHKAKLAQAERNRERLLEAKYDRYVELSERFQALNETTKRLVEERSELIARAEERRKRAVEKRQQLLLDIKKKAHDEESKAKEIAFINLLETQIKRKDVMSSAHAKEVEVGERLQSREEERKLKLEERLNKLTAVLERQSQIKKGWEAKLAEMEEKRRIASERILRDRQKRAKERSELALEKARGREKRLLEMNAASQAKTEELKKSIEQKQQDTARRHEENIEQIRQKAIEFSIPRTSEDVTVRMCSLCKVVIQSEVQELSHLRSRSHLDGVRKAEKENSVNSQNLQQQSIIVGSSASTETFGIQFITDVLMDKLESLPKIAKPKLTKKHCKKLVQKLLVSGKDFEALPVSLPGSIQNGEMEKKQWTDPSTLKKIQKNIREMDRLITLFNSQRGTCRLATSLDRVLAETRKAAVRNPVVQNSLISMGFFSVLTKILDSKAPDLPQKTLLGACNLLVGANYRHLFNSLYTIRGSTICAILELSSRRWENLIPDGHRWLCGSPVGNNEPLPSDPVIDSLIELLGLLLAFIPDPFDGIRSPKQNFLNEADIKDIQLRTMDIIGYIVASGIIDRLAVYCSGVRGPVEGQQPVANLLKGSIDFLTTLVYSVDAVWDVNKKVDTTQLLAALESSEVAGSVSMSYSLLLHCGAPSRPCLVTDESGPLPPPVGPLSSSLVQSTLSLINAIAKVDLNSLQRVLGSESVTLQYRHIVSQLLWQAIPHMKIPQSSPNSKKIQGILEENRNSFLLIKELLISIGNFTVNNPINQRIIQSGPTPTILQQLCTLPDPYFKELILSRYLFPTLIACTFGSTENQQVLKNYNIEIELLEGFMTSEFAKTNPICKQILAKMGSNYRNISSNLSSINNQKAHE